MSRNRRPRDKWREHLRRGLIKMVKTRKGVPLFLDRMCRPRDAAEAREWLKQLAGNLRDVLAKPDEVPLNPDLANWLVDLVDASFPDETAPKGQTRRVSMGVVLSFKQPRGRPLGTEMGGREIAKEVFRGRRRKETWEKISERLGIGVRSLQRTSAAHVEEVAKDFLQHAVPSVPLGYDLKDGKLVINKNGAAKVRMIFESYAQLGAAPAPKRAHAALVRKLKAEGITLYRVLNNQVYIGETVPKGRYRGKHKAIIDRALFLKVHRTRRALTARRQRRLKPRN
jgi:hypothetical protein